MSGDIPRAAYAVAPIHMVRRVADYALSRIPAEKISLGIPNYGYDWPFLMSGDAHGQLH